jgi:hypothetical protein
VAIPLKSESARPPAAEWRPFSQLPDNERELAAERDAIEAA